MVMKVFDAMMGDPIYGNVPNAGTEPLIIMLLTASIIAGILLKIFLDKHSDVIYYVVVIVFSFGAGRLCHYFSEQQDVILTPAGLVPGWAMKILMALIISWIPFHLDNIKFLAFSEVVYVLVIGTAFYVTYFSIFMSVMFWVYSRCFDWQAKSVIIMCFAVSMFQPELTIQKLETEAGHVKYLQALLKADVLWSILIAFTVIDIVLKAKDIPYNYNGSPTTDLIRLIAIQSSGIFVGLLFGLLVQLVFKYSYLDTICPPVLSILACVLVYSSAELIQTSGCAATAFYGVFVTVIMKPMMLASNEKFCKQLWGVIYFFAATFLFSVYGFILGAMGRAHDIRMLCFSFGIFATSIMLRFVFCFLLLPYLYGGRTKWTELALAVVGPYRGLCSSLLAVRYTMDNTDESFQVLIEVFLVVMMSLFMNVILLDWFLVRLDVFQLNKPQISNMNNAVEQINKCRSNMIFAEKLDRIVADANWLVVSQITRFSHPYKKILKSSEFSEAILKEDIKTVQCPKCGMWLISPPTKKELDELTRETKLRVMKAQQVSYLKQRDAGTLTVYGYKFLSNLLYQASFSNELSVKTDELRITTEDLTTMKKMESCFQSIYNVTQDNYAWEPTNRIRSKCYNIATSLTFRILMTATSVVDMFFCLSFLYLYVASSNSRQNHPEEVSTVLRTYGKVVAGFSLFFYATNLMEAIIQIFGLGVEQYFSERVYIVEFLSCIIMRSFQEIIYCDQCYKNGQFISLLDCHEVVVYMNIVMLLRITRFYLFFVSLIPSILTRINEAVEQDLLKKYDIGKAYLVGLDRVLKYLSQLSTNQQVLDDVRKEIDADRLKVSKELGLIQKEHPTIAITVKTKHAIRHVINAMNDCTNSMQDEGILDSIEYTAFMKTISKLKDKLNEMTVIVPPSPINIMKEIQWLRGDEVNTELFLNEAQMSNYDYNDVLIRHGDDPVGLYILVSGLLKACYIPSPTSLQLSAKFGVIPNYDFFENFKFDQPQEDYIVSGNVVGEFGVLTGRRYDMTIIAETAVQVFYIPWSVTKLLHDTYAGDLLLAKIWRKVAIKISHTLLQFTAAYRHWSSERLLIFLQRGTVPNLNGIGAINLDHRVEEAILVEGVALDVNSSTIIYGPFRIPKTVTKLLLPDNQAWDFQTVYETKLFIVLVHGVAVRDILEENVLAPVSQESEKMGKKVERTRKVGFTEESD